VHPSMPATSLAQFIALCEGKPGQAELWFHRRRIVPSADDGALQDKDRRRISCTFPTRARRRPGRSDGRSDSGGVSNVPALLAPVRPDGYARSR
jgi:hypothetical protein